MNVEVSKEATHPNVPAKGGVEIPAFLKRKEEAGKKAAENTGAGAAAVTEKK